MKKKDIKWRLHKYKEKVLLLWGLKHGLITPYENDLIEKLRTIYHGGLPASIILLSNEMTNGHCYDRAVLMARAFLDTNDDVNLLYVSIDSLRLNPEFEHSGALSDDHCIVERITKEGKHLIYDTSTGFIYDKKIYWLIEHPRIRKVNKKQSIIDYVQEDENMYPEDIEKNKYIAPLVLSMLEMTYNRPYELYASIGVLQGEIEHYKQVINYDSICQEIDEDMKRKGLKK